jgi:hypothetical protein
MANERIHLSKTPEYSVWKTMRQRCDRDPNYRDRGITVCDRWQWRFNLFLADMGPRPSKAHTLERIDNDGPYAPLNCRWATRSEQNRNSRQNVWITAFGEVALRRDWARWMGLPEGTIRSRLNSKRAWTIEDALLTPVEVAFRPKRRRAKKS